MKNRHLRTLLSTAAAYGGATCIGLALVLSCFPHWALVGGLPAGAPPRADFAQHVIGQLYFFSEPWAGIADPLRDARLDPPAGTSIGLTDSIPLLAVLAKALMPLLPRFQQVITLYQAAAWVLQAVCAVFALRSAGERRWLPAMAIAVMAISMPTFLYRMWHAALSGHCWLLLMLGLSLRITRTGSRAALKLACCLQVGLLLIHPYLMVMASGMFLAAPISQYWRGDCRWRWSAAGIVLSSAAVLLVGQWLGYWGGASDGGFGYYSMNLISPFWPTFSTIFPDIPYAAGSLSDGQAEGYQYLGLGGIGLGLVSLGAWRQWRTVLARHPGLLLACGAFLLLAVTNWVSFMHTLVVHVPFPAPWLDQMRASGRLFWVVTYTWLVAAYVVILRRYHNLGVAMLLAAACVQFADAQILRQQDSRELTSVQPYPFDAQRLETILAAHTHLTVLPTFPCNGGGEPVNLDLLWLAARTRMTINSVYAARETNPQTCLPAASIDGPPAIDEVRVVLPGFSQALIDVAGTDDCRLLPPFAVCTRRTDLLQGLARPAPIVLPTSTSLALKAGSMATEALLAGWSAVSPEGGVWTSAQVAYLGIALGRPARTSFRISVHGYAMPERAGFHWHWGRQRPQTREVTVWAGNDRIATWHVGLDAADHAATVPLADVQGKNAVVIALHTGPLVSLLDRGLGLDSRRFGLWIDQATFTPEPGGDQTGAP